MNPFVRLHYRDGMLLSALDFRVEQEAHVLRRQLHQAALHGSGTVLGLALRPDTQPDDELFSSRLIVEPGLAVDFLGRDIFVAEPLCLDVAPLLRDSTLWSSLSRPSDSLWTRPLPAQEVVDPAQLRVAYVVLRHQSCLTDPVPALSAPCGPVTESLAHSRQLDSYRVDLVAAPPAEPEVLFPDITADEHLTLREALLSACLEANVGRAQEIWQKNGTTPLLLAAVLLAPARNGEEALVVDVDNSLRPLLPPTQLVAELWSGHRLSHPDTAPLFRVQQVATTADTDHLSIDVTFSAAPLAATLISATELHLLDADDTAEPWKPVELTAGDNTTVSANTLQIRLPLEPESESLHLQLFIHGTGPRPALSEEAYRLTGGAGDPLPGAGKGRDFDILIHWQNTSSGETSDDE